MTVFARTIEDCDFVSERLYTDTRIWQVIGRTAKTLTIRATRHTNRWENVTAYDPGACGVYPQLVVVEPWPDGEVVTVRRRKDGTYRIHGGRQLNPVTGEPKAFIDYRY